MGETAGTSIDRRGADGTAHALVAYNPLQLFHFVKETVLVLPAEDLRGRQLHISTAELAGCCRARLPRCAPAQGPSRLSLRP